MTKQYHLAIPFLGIVHPVPIGPDDQAHYQLAANASDRASGLTPEQVAICKAFGRDPRDVFPELYLAPNAATVPTLGPMQSLRATADEIPERVTLMSDLAPDRAQTLGQALAGRTLALRVGLLPTDPSVGELTGFVVEPLSEYKSEISAELTLTPAAKRSYRAHAGPAAIQAVLQGDDVVGAIWHPPAGAANSQQSKTYTAEESTICRMFGRSPAELDELE